jgi:hypothetical protein
MTTGLTGSDLGATGFGVAGLTASAAGDLDVTSGVLIGGLAAGGNGCCGVGFGAGGGVTGCEGLTGCSVRCGRTAPVVAADGFAAAGCADGAVVFAGVGAGAAGAVF